MPSLCHGLRAQHSTDRAWLRLFHGLSLDRHPSVSGFVLRNFFSCHVPVMSLCLFLYEHTYVYEKTL